MYTLLFLMVLTAAQLNVYGAKVVAVAGACYVLLELLQKIEVVCNLPTWVKVLANILLNTAGVLMVTPAGELWTIQTLTAVLLAIGSAAGIHGTVKSLTAPAVPPAGVPNGGNPAVGAKGAS